MTRKDSLMRVVLLAAVALSLAATAGCDDGPQRREGAAAPVGAPSPSVSAPALPATSSPGPISTTAGSKTASPAGSKTGSTGVAAPGRCQANQLRGDIEQFERPGQAGAEQLARVRLTNTGARCTMSGFVSLRLLAADGKPRETSIVHAGDPPKRVTLGKGQTAWAMISWMFTPDPGEENTEPLCGPKPTAALVTPPGVSGTIRITEKFGTVCRHGEIWTSPVTTTKPV
jgi:hypothetical protein